MECQATSREQWQAVTRLLSSKERRNAKMMKTLNCRRSLTFPFGLVVIHEFSSLVRWKQLYNSKEYCPWRRRPLTIPASGRPRQVRRCYGAPVGASWRWIYYLSQEKSIHVRLAPRICWRGGAERVFAWRAPDSSPSCVSTPRCRGMPRRHWASRDRRWSAR
jgi:hypothetical protein